MQRMLHRRHLNASPYRLFSPYFDWGGDLDLLWSGGEVAAVVSVCEWGKITISAFPCAI